MGFVDAVGGCVPVLSFGEVLVWCGKDYHFAVWTTLYI